MAIKHSNIIQKGIQHPESAFEKCIKEETLFALGASWAHVDVMVTEKKEDDGIMLF